MTKKTDKSKLIPRNDYVLIRRDAPPYNGLIELPDAVSKARATIGTVLAKGPGKKYPLEVEVGDVVNFKYYAGVTVEGQVYAKDSLVMLLEEDIYGVIEQ